MMAAVGIASPQFRISMSRFRNFAKTDRLTDDARAHAGGAGTPGSPQRPELEGPVTESRLDNLMTLPASLQGLVVIGEVQRADRCLQTLRLASAASAKDAPGPQ